MLALLLACAPPDLAEGEVVAEYSVVHATGGEVGTATLRAFDGGWSEQIRVEGKPVLETQARLLAAGEASRWVDAGGSVTRADLDGQVVTLRQGLKVHRHPLDEPPDAVVAAATIGGGPDLPVILGGWAQLCRHPPADGMLVALDLPHGRLTPLKVEERQREGDAVRWFAHTAGQGQTVWCGDDGALLDVALPLSGLDLRRTGFAPTAPPPEGRVDEEVTVDVPDGRLAGTLTHPAAGGPWPLLVLVPGSGPVSRNEDFGGMRPDLFSVLAARGAQAGFAVLRTDKRGVGDSVVAEDAPHTLDALAADQLAWLDALAARPSIRADCLVVAGHSEGGTIAPLLAVQDERVAGVAMIAGAASNLEVVLREQLVSVLRAHGATDEEIAQAARHQDASLRLIASGKDRELPLSSGSQTPSDWLRSHFAHDPAAVLRQVRVPILALFGSADLQVLPVEAERLRALVPAEIAIFDGVDHLMMPVDEPVGLGSYADPDRHVDPRVVDRLVDWLGGVCPTP